MTASLRSLLAIAGAPRRQVAVSVLLGALTVLAGVGLMATAGYLISRAAERPTIFSLTIAIVGVRFFGISRPVVRYLDRLWGHDLALRVLTRVRSRTYQRIEPLAPAELEGYRDGDLLSRSVADVDALQNLHLRVVGPPLVALLAGAVSVGVAAAFLPAAGVVLAVGLIAGGVAVPVVSGWLGRTAGERQAPARGMLSAEFVETLGAVPELVAFGAERAALARVGAADSSLVAVARRSASAAGVGDGLRLLVSGATVVGVLAVAANASGAGHLDRVLIAMLALLALASFEAVAPLSAAARELSSTLAAGKRVLELTDREAAVRDPATPTAGPAWPFAIALEGVGARYPGGSHPVLADVSLRLEPGERVALVGPSGAGKTTIVNLLLRFLDPESGRVTLAGRDLRDYRQDDVRRVISVAGQESYLFATTIRDNVRLARPDAGDAELEQALRRARIWDWVEGLPDGVQTRVGERGRELSGGQRQRILLARALLADAPVLVLDEPTAHLDPATAEELVRDVFAATDGRTVLLITHRSEGLELVDRVVTLPARAAMSAAY
ncbi:MAG TPA: thiol reductant ABC exporter subunit CydC [Polyangiaceae bacterium]|nr:thiol reductant ABC exporter subunit CydC [Polyangiaceae bacterium]